MKPHPKPSTRHNVLVDISGRLEKADREDVAIAFSNEIAHAIFIPGKVKLEANEMLRRAGISVKRRGVRMVVVGLYLLLIDFIPQLDRITIDDELPGWGAVIKQQLLDLIWRRYPHVEKHRIDVRTIGAHTNADQGAWLAREKRITPYKRITFNDFEELFQ